MNLYSYLEHNFRGKGDVMDSKGILFYNVSFYSLQRMLPQRFLDSKVVCDYYDQRDCKYVVEIEGDKKYVASK